MGVAIYPLHCNNHYEGWNAVSWAQVSLLSFQLQPHGRYVCEFGSKPLGNIIAMVVPLRERETLNYTKISE